MIGAAIGLGLGIVSSAVTSLSGLKRAREAKRAIAEIEANRIEYENNFNNVQVSTLGSDFQKEQLRQNNATLIGNLRSGGSRAMVGTIPQLVANNNKVSRTIGADLDEQQKYIDLKSADYQNKIQEVYDQRQRDALIGYGTELNAARQDITTGLNNAAGIALASSPYLEDAFAKRPYVQANPTVSLNNYYNRPGVIQRNDFSVAMPSIGIIG